MRRSCSVGLAIQLSNIDREWEKARRLMAVVVASGSLFYARDRVVTTAVISYLLHSRSIMRGRSSPSLP